MTNRADRYIEDVLRRVVLPSSRKEALRMDLREHFAAAEEGREPVEEIIRRLGEPEEVAASFMEGAELRYAGVLPRAFAFVADFGFCLLSLAPALFFGAIFAGLMEAEAEGFRIFVVFCGLALSALAGLGVFLLYFPILEHFFGWTLGKRWMKLRVVSEQGGPIGLGAAFIRRLPYYFELIWLDGIFAIFTEKKQRAFDIVAKTAVVDEPDGGRNILHYMLCLLPFFVILAFLAFCAMIGVFHSA